jgi:hypothetical protein
MPIMIMCIVTKYDERCLENEMERKSAKLDR